MATNVAPTGMYFTISPTGALIPQNFTDMAGGGGGANAEVPFPGDFQIVCTVVPAGTSAATVAALITANVSLPLPFGPGFHWKVAYASISAPLVATPW